MNPDKLIIPLLNTERLNLVPLSFSHSKGMFELWSNDLVVKYSGPITDSQGQGIEMPAKSSMESDKLIEFWIKASEEGWGNRWAILLKEDNDFRFIGIVGFNSLGSDYEIAFHLLPKYWGRGLMLEASKVAIDWAYSRGAKSVEAFIESENKESLSFAKKLDMQFIEESEEGIQKYSLQL